MIDIGRFESCVCTRRGQPDEMCSGPFSFEEKGEKVRLQPQGRDEEAKAVVLDQCVFRDNNPRCDGLFLFRRQHRYWMILVELKGTHLDDAVRQLAATKHNRPEYREIKKIIGAGARGQLTELAFIVSSAMLSRPVIQRLENQNNISIKDILHSTATTPIPDLRNNLH
jgi:hypothetical protein